MGCGCFFKSSIHTDPKIEYQFNPEFQAKSFGIVENKFQIDFMHGLNPNCEKNANSSKNFVNSKNNTLNQIQKDEQMKS